MGRWAKIIQSFSIDIFNIQDIKLSFSGYGRERIVDVGKTHHDGLCQQAGCHQERHDGRWLAEVKTSIYVQKAPKNEGPLQSAISFRSGDLVSIDNENFHAIVGREKV